MFDEVAAWETWGTSYVYIGNSELALLPGLQRFEMRRCCLRM